MLKDYFVRVFIKRVQSNRLVLLRVTCCATIHAHFSFVDKVRYNTDTIVHKFMGSKLGYLECKLILI